MDINVQAFRLVQEATSEARPNKVRQMASRKGGIKGGAARAKFMDPERRSEIARNANQARWHKQTSIPAA